MLTRAARAAIAETREHFGLNGDGLREYMREFLRDELVRIKRNKHQLFIRMENIPAPALSAARQASASGRMCAGLAGHDT